MLQHNYIQEVVDRLEVETILKLEESNLFFFSHPRDGNPSPTSLPTPLLIQFVRLAPFLYPWHVPRDTRRHNNRSEGRSISPISSPFFAPTTPRLPNLIKLINSSPLNKFHFVSSAIPDSIFNHV